MSVDTISRGSRTRGYQVTQVNGLDVLVSHTMAQFVTQIFIDVKRKLWWNSVVLSFEEDQQCLDGL